MKNKSFLAIAKLHTLIFIIKLIILVPLSWFVIALAAGLTGGGHGNYLPTLIVLGPMSFCFLIKTFSFTHIIWGTVCLYEAYALFIKFVKAEYAFSLVLRFHMISCMVAFPFYIGTYRLLGDELLIVLLLNVVFIGIPISVIWIILASIRKTNEDIGDKKNIKNEL